MRKVAAVALFVLAGFGGLRALSDVFGLVVERLPFIDREMLMLVERPSPAVLFVDLAASLLLGGLLFWGARRLWRRKEDQPTEETPQNT